MGSAMVTQNRKKQLSVWRAATQIVSACAQGRPSRRASGYRLMLLLRCALATYDMPGDLLKLSLVYMRGLGLSSNGAATSKRTLDSPATPPL